jgi:hypothetical protein
MSLNSILLIVIAILFAFVFYNMYGHYRTYRGKYEALGRALCDPDSWVVKTYLRILVLKGRVDGHPIRFSVFGDERNDRKTIPTSTYLLLEHPVKTNLRVYAGGDLDATGPEPEPQLYAISDVPDFRGLVLTPARSPWIGKVLARPLGLGYQPGVLLWKFGLPSFDPEPLRKEIALLIDLVSSGA